MTGVKMWGELGLKNTVGVWKHQHKRFQAKNSVIPQKIPRLLTQNSYFTSKIICPCMVGQCKNTKNQKTCVSFLWCYIPTIESKQQHQPKKGDHNRKPKVYRLVSDSRLNSHYTLIVCTHNVISQWASGYNYA